MVGIYARVSTLKQKDNYSLPLQKRRGIEFAKQTGEDCVIYEEARSGSSMILRTELGRLLADIEKGAITKVWAIELTRLSRNVEDFQVLKRVFRKSKTQLFINGILTNLDSAEQRFSYNVNAAMAEFERERIVERVIRGLGERKDAGKSHFPHMLGYDGKYDESGNIHYAINQNEAEIVRTIFKNKKDGWTLSRLAKYLNDNHIKTKMGGVWTRRSILNILHHRIYTGKTETRDKRIIDSRLYEPIIAEEDFRYVWENYNWGQRHHNFLDHYRFQSSGLIKCPICGMKWRYYKNSKNSKTYEYYRADHLSGCTNRRKGFRKAYVDDALDRMFFVAFLRLQDLEASFSKKREEKIKKNVGVLKQMEKLQEEQKQLEHRRDKIVEAISSEAITLEDAKAKMKDLNERRAVIESELAQVKSEAEENVDPRIALGMFTAKQLAKYIESTEAEKKKLLQDVTREITVLNGEMTVVFLSGLSLKVNLDTYRDDVLRVYGKADKLYGNHNESANKLPSFNDAMQEGESTRKRAVFKFVFHAGAKSEGF